MSASMKPAMVAATLVSTAADGVGELVGQAGPAAEHQLEGAGALADEQEVGPETGEDPLVGIGLGHGPIGDLPKQLLTDRP